MRLLAPAKINLHLRVGPPRADGFHPICSWMVTIGLFDNLIIDFSHTAGIDLRCDDPHVPCGQSNLVVRALHALCDAGGRQAPPLQIRLEKRIPAGAGLGGGSSDAIATLIGLNQVLDFRLSRDELAEIAATLGSDLPFFLHGSSAICRGRGELVQPVRPPRAKWTLLIFPGTPMPTASVYQQFDRMNLGTPPEIFFQEPDWNTWSDMQAEQLLPALQNDLEPAAFALCPGLGDLRASLEQTLGRTVRMSGSGSTLFTLFDDRGAAQCAASRIAQHPEHKVFVAPLAPDVTSMV